MKEQEVKILLVEDDEIDVMTIQRVLQKKHVSNQLSVANDGIEALDFLRGTNGQEKIERPYIIFLDLNMPRMGGLEFLEVLRQDQELHDSIVFVLTTSNSDEDRCRAYEKNIAGYILKSDVDSSLSNTISMLDLYWKVVELPV